MATRYSGDAYQNDQTQDQTQSATRRSSADQERDKAVYEYLLNSLTDLGLKRSDTQFNDKPVKPNESLIAAQWGQKDNRIFVRRVLRTVLPERYEGETTDYKLPALTLGKLVEILESIQEYWAKQDPEHFSRQVPKILTRAEKRKALSKFSQLSIEERSRLKLPIRPSDVLMKQLVESMTDPVQGLSDDEAIRFYQMTQDFYQSVRSDVRSLIAPDKNADKDQESPVRRLVKKRVQTLVKEHFRQRPNSEKQVEVIDKLVRKIEREISRVSFQCGFRQVESLLNKEQHPNKEQSKIADRCLPQSFVEHLIRSLFENEILTDEFPIYIKHYTVEKIRPLPLYFKTKDKLSGLLNPELLDSLENEDEVNGLERQFAYKVVVHFYVKLPNHYKPPFPNPNSSADNQISEQRFDFFEEVRGVGSLISLITSAINSVLLSGIPVLQEKKYFPIAQERLRINEVIGQNGYNPVWSQNHVRLCKEPDIKAAIDTQKPYEQVVQDLELSHGEFCGFDLIEVTANAALYARLRAIKEAGIDAERYITELCNRVLESQALKQATSYLELYPFSLRAMEAHLDRTVFYANRYRSRNRQFEFKEQEPKKPWSLIAYDAHLAIARAYLMEGLYRVGKRYLDVLKPHIDNGFLSDAQLAKYQLCRYRYYNLADLDDRDYFPDSGRFEAVRRAYNALDQAERHIHDRLRKYHVLDEFSQSNFHPSCYLLSKINAHRAKLYIFASVSVPSDGRQWDNLTLPIRLLEKARIYAAQDGATSEYSYWSAYQSWCYLMLAYLRDSNHPSSSSKLALITFQECIDWARRLIDHALICYSSLGQQCYQTIKDNGGRVTEDKRDTKTGLKYYEKYGNVEIQMLPFIEESKAQDEENEPNKDSRILRLDLSLLKIEREVWLGNRDMIHLLGTHSALLLFPMGMLELCEEREQPAQLKEKVQKAEKLFTYAWATASDGVLPELEGDRLFLDRKLELDDPRLDREALIQGLYPHRLTQFADLGKVFAAVCKVLLLPENPEEAETQWRQIWYLLDALHCGEHSGSETILEQRRYNGHLSTHFKNIRNYFHLLQNTPLEGSMIERRDRIIKQVFQYILGRNE
ncbi:hypothetical protein H6F89_23015 [Cyanobacteria bacterium FACHB-63]|nr:hypothetical protein [Cyanobacteria bacterium FACHB-63]